MITLFSMSNQNGAPKETAQAVMSRPRIFVTMPQPAGVGRNGLCQPTGSPDAFNTATCCCSAVAFCVANATTSVVVLGGVFVVVPVAVFVSLTDVAVVAGVPVVADVPGVAVVTVFPMEVLAALSATEAVGCAVSVVLAGAVVVAASGGGSFAALMASL